MSGIAVRYIDVYVLRRVSDGWELLTLRRASGTRCTGAWEVVHGHLEEGERAVPAALRELKEETGYAAARLYNLSRVETFYRHTTDEVALIPVFVALVTDPADPRPGAEHDAWRWRTLPDAGAALAWPRSARALEDIARIFAGGVDAGPLEDVLRVC
ncbi:MAG: NUDIX domain-containing protein [Gemmatimonadetes bacterium]|nr:NUDIX domain-containing protein [Gemmatimonadota bacterium]